MTDPKLQSVPVTVSTLTPTGVNPVAWLLVIQAIIDAAPTLIAVWDRLQDALRNRRQSAGGTPPEGNP